MKKYFSILISLVFFSLAFLVPAKEVNTDLNFKLDKVLIKYILEPGDSVSDKILIINSDKPQMFSIDSEADFIFVENKELILGKKESGNFNIVLDTLDKKPGVYVGELIVSGEKNKVNIPTILGIETPSPLFDVSIEVPIGSSAVSGENFIAEVSVYKFKGQDDAVELRYFLSDTKGKIIFSESQSLNVAKQTKITKTIPLPPNAVGNYVFFVTAHDTKFVSTGISAQLISTAPSLSPKSEDNDYYFLVSIMIVIILIISFLLFNHYWNKKLVKNAREWNQKVISVKKIKFSDTNREIRKLNNKKTLLEKAYSKGYISKKSLEESRKNINIAIRKLKKRL